MSADLSCNVRCGVACARIGPGTPHRHVAVGEGERGIRSGCSANLAREHSFNADSYPMRASASAGASGKVVAMRMAFRPRGMPKP
jgi:hypothetical protein